MQDLLEEEVTELKNDFKKQRKVTEGEISSNVKELDQQLQNVVHKVSSEYQLQDESAVQELKENKLKEFEQYCNEQMQVTRDTTQRLKTSPRAMQDLLKKKVTELKNDFKKQLTVTEGEISSDVKELDQRLRNVVHDFCSNYQRLFESAVREFKKKQLKDFDQYCEQEIKSMNTESISIPNTPNLMRKLLKTKSKQLLDNFHQSLGESAGEMEPEILNLQTEFMSVRENRIQSFTPTFNSVNECLEQEKRAEFPNLFNQKGLNNELESCCESYELMFTLVIAELKKRKLEIFHKQVGPMDINAKTITHTPDSMRKNLDDHSKQLLKDFCDSLGERGKEMEPEISDLEKTLCAEIENAVQSLTHNFTSVIQCRKEERLKELRSFGNKKVQSMDNGTSSNPNNPIPVRKSLETDLKQLFDNFRQSLGENAGPLEPEILKFESEIQNRTQTECLKQQKLVEFQNIIIQKKQGWWAVLRSLWPFTDSMKTILKEEAESILSDFKRCLCDDYPEKESVVAELREEMWRLIRE